MHETIEPVVALPRRTSGSLLFHVESPLPHAVLRQQLRTVIGISPKTPTTPPCFPNFTAMKPPAQRLRQLPVPLWLGLTILLTTPACGRSSSDVREWQPSDHDQPIGPSGQVAAKPGSSSQSGPDKSLVELAWQRNCASCHGAVGRGDGPQGPMVRAPDLTRSEWQTQVTDDQIAEVIRKGRNRMPAFEALPPQVITGLVARIRDNRAR